MSYIGHCHVNVKVLFVKSGLYPTQSLCSRADRPKLLLVSIDARNALEELLSVAEQASVMIQLVHNDFESTLPNGLQKIRSDFVALLGNNLKGRLDSECLVHVHQICA